MAASQNLLNRFGTEVNGVFAPNESTLAGMLLALNNAGLSGGKVQLVGFANNPSFAAALKRNDLHGLILQDPVKMGYLVKTIVQVLRGEGAGGCRHRGLPRAENLTEPNIAALPGNIRRSEPIQSVFS